jgi:hypothetical protein
MTTRMYFTSDGFVISGYELFWIIFGIITIVAILKLLGRIVGRIVSRWNSKSEDYPGSTKSGNYHSQKKFRDFADFYLESDLDTKRSLDSLDTSDTLDISDTSDTLDVHGENDLDTERRERVIFEEMISNVPFRYDEKTKILTIGEGHNSSVEPIKVKLSSLDDLREFVDRLEDYVNE